MSRCDGWTRGRHDVARTSFKVVLHKDSHYSIGGTLYLCPECMADVIKDPPVGQWSAERHIESSRGDEIMERLRVAEQALHRVIDAAERAIGQVRALLPEDEWTT